MPRTAPQQALHLRDDQPHDEIRNQERNRTALLARSGLFQCSNQRQQDKNMARKKDLSLEVAAVGLINKHLIGAHARRHTSCATFDAFSVVQLARQDAAVVEAPCTSLQRLSSATIRPGCKAGAPYVEEKTLFDCELYGPPACVFSCRVGCPDVQSV